MFHSKNRVHHPSSNPWKTPFPLPHLPFTIKLPIYHRSLHTTTIDRYQSITTSLQQLHQSINLILETISMIVIWIESLPNIKIEINMLKYDHERPLSSPLFQLATSNMKEKKTTNQPSILIWLHKMLFFFSSQMFEILKFHRMSLITF